MRKNIITGVLIVVVAVASFIFGTMQGKTEMKAD